MNPLSRFSFFFQDIGKVDRTDFRWRFVNMAYSLNVSDNFAALLGDTDDLFNKEFLLWTCGLTE